MSLDQEAGTLTLTIPLDNPPTPSASGRSLVIASSRGPNKSNITIQGRPLIISLNAYVKRGA